MGDDTKKKLAIGIAIFLIVLILVYAFFRKTGENYYKIKKEKNNYLVYSKVEKENYKYSKYIPYLNIESEASDAVNNDIDEFTTEFIDKGNCAISYEYDINGIVLSLALKIIDYSSGYAPEIHFRSYNMSLETLELISDESLLDFYDVNSDYAYTKIEEKFKEYYEDTLDQGYYEEEECDYNCFLELRGFEDYLDDVNYYVKSGKLIAFKPFIIHSIYGEEEYFKDEDFKIIITAKES